MILKSDQISERLDKKSLVEDKLMIIPTPDLKDLKESGSGAIDFRLGTWFVEMKRSKLALFNIGKSNKGEHTISKKHYVPFGKNFILHPKSFVLGVTLEWVRIPSDLAAYVVGKSSWGRRGLIIATAAGVHPGFTGCLTLELSNLGEVPIEIQPGMKICQLFIHTVQTGEQGCVDKSDFSVKRQPTVGNIQRDEITEILSLDWKTRK